MLSKTKAKAAPRKRLQLPDHPDTALALTDSVPRDRLNGLLKERPEDDPERRAFASHDAFLEALAPANRRPGISEEAFREGLRSGGGHPEIAAQVAAMSAEEFERLEEEVKNSMPDTGMILTVKRGRVHSQQFCSRHGATLEIFEPGELPIGVEGPGWLQWRGVIVDGPRVVMWPPFTPEKIIAENRAMLTIDRELKAEANKFNLSQVGGENKAKWDGGQSVAKAIRETCLREGLTCAKLLDRLRSEADGIQVDDRKNDDGQEEWFFSSQEEKRDPWAVKKSSFPATVSRWRREAGTT